jgi:hypothetical protein
MMQYMRQQAVVILNIAARQNWQVDKQSYLRNTQLLQHAVRP